MPTRTESVDSRTSLRKEIDFELAKIGATTAIFKERASVAVGRTGDAVDAGSKVEKRVTKLWSWGRALKEAFEKLSDGGGL